MQFTDLIFIFLERLGYTEQSVILTTIPETLAGEDEDYRYESPAVLVLGKNEEQVIGVFMLADAQDRRSTVAKSASLEAYCEKFNTPVSMYIISQVLEAASLQDMISFYKCDSNGQSSRVDINEFPSHSDMWLAYFLSENEHKTACEGKHSDTLVVYAYFFALVFVVLAVGDVIVEKILDVSYLNTQRTLLLVVSALLLFVPEIVKKKKCGR